MSNTAPPILWIDHRCYGEIRPRAVLFKHPDSSNNLFLPRTPSGITSRQTSSGRQVRPQLCPHVQFRRRAFDSRASRISLQQTEDPDKAGLRSDRNKPHDSSPGKSSYLIRKGHFDHKSSPKLPLSLFSTNSRGISGTNQSAQ